MEQSNRIQRSEVWEQIYKVVSKIPRKYVDGDAADAPSVTTELEELFLKLLPIQHVRQRLLDRIKEIEDGKEEYRTSGKTYSRQGREYWEGGYLIVLKELKSLLNVV